MWSSSSIRQQFIDFFKQKGHQYVPAAPIVNKEDPSLLFTNAGMNQFKDFFLNHHEATHSRVVNAQPCLRVSGKHNDLEEVGVDTYHHTMFEMLGNWSFGEYFKEETIAWAWELITEVYKLPKERLYVTVFEGDQAEDLAPDHDVYDIWSKYIEDKDHILYGNKRDNFWEMGDMGPCGPCSEMHVDIRTDEEIRLQPGKELVNTGHPQVVEIWNFVFIQYNRLASGQLVELAAKHVDTGMGLERLTMILQGKNATYNTDIFLPLIHNIMRLSQKVYGQDPQVDIAMRVIADHIRAIAFVIADGQLPSNVQAGYVIRRILRRAVRYGYTYLSFETPFLYQLISVLAHQFKTAYPQIKQQQSYIEQIIKSEEASFFKTLALGLQRLDHISITLHKSDQRVIDGATAFELYDTYGFPIDLTCLVAQEKGLEVDQTGFQQALQAQRTRSQKAASISQGDWHIVSEGHGSFVGYDQLETHSKILQYRSVRQKDKEIYQIVLDKSPFYPEGGGQVGDTGKLIIGKQVIAVFDTKKEYDHLLHYTYELPNDLQGMVQAVVDLERRRLITNNHTATHLLQATLKQVLGPHVVQKGSLVNEKLLRFDFAHYAKVSDEQLQDIERIVNQKIRANIALQEMREVRLEEAKAMGATALFEENYGEYVRVIIFDPAFSQELCGGTHAASTGSLGFFKIISQTGIAAGTRRIEAITNIEAEKFVDQQLTMLRQMAEALKKQPESLLKSIYQLLEEKHQLEKKVTAYQAQEVRSVIDHLHQQLYPVHGVHMLAKEVTLSHVDSLKKVGLSFKGNNLSCFVVLTAIIDQQPHIALFISEDLVKKFHMDANVIIKELATLIQGGGGGQPFFATAKGSEVTGLSHVLTAARLILEQSIL
eukprot:gene325-416_t